MPYFTYILKSKVKDTFYIGQTQNVEKRLARHNKGLVKSTKRYIPWEVVYSKEFETRTEAILHENKLKSFKSFEYIEKYILGENRCRPDSESGPSPL